MGDNGCFNPHQAGWGRAGVGITHQSFRGGGTGGAGDAIAPPIFLEIDKIKAFCIPNIFGLKEGATWKKG